MFIQIQNWFCQSRVVKEFEGGEGEIEGSGGMEGGEGEIEGGEGI